MSNEQRGPDQLDYRAFGLLGPRTIGPRTIGPSDYRALGLLGPRTIGLMGPPDYRALGTTGREPNAQFSHY